MAYLFMILSYLTIILHHLTMILTSLSNFLSNSLPVIFTGLVVIFTGLYWWNARRAFLLELDRVVLWFILEGGVKKERYEKQAQETIRELENRNSLDPSNIKDLNFMKKIQEYSKREEVIKEMGADIAFFDTLVSKKLRRRLKKHEKKQKEWTSNLRNYLKKKNVNNGKTERRKNEK